MPLYRARSKSRVTSYAGSSTVANDATELAFGLTHTIPAGSLTVGKTYRISAMGTYRTAASAPLLNTKVRVGGTDIGQTGSFTQAATVSNSGFRIDETFVVVSTGTSAQVEAQGYIKFSQNGTDAKDADLETTATQTINSTIDQLISIRVKWGAADANNSITLRQLVIEELGV